MTKGREEEFGENKDEYLVCSFEGIKPSNMTVSPKLSFFWNKYVNNYGPMAQLVRAPPCHGGGRGFESHSGRFKWNLGS